MWHPNMLHSHIIHEIEFGQAHYVIHQTIQVHDSFSLCFWLPSNLIYAAELAAPGVKNMGAPWNGSQAFMACTQCNSSIHSGQSAFSQPALFHLAVMGHARMYWSSLSRGRGPLHIAGPTSSSWRTQPHAFHTHHKAGLVMPHHLCHHHHHTHRPLLAMG